MTRRPRLNHIIPVIMIMTVVFLLMRMSYAQTSANSHGVAPEPGTIGLILLTIWGGLARFTRRRFNEFKRAFDIVASAMGLVIAAPVIAFLAIIIKIVSPGPAILRQERVGLGGTAFNMYKLRTMKVDAEKDTGPVWAKENDPRLITFGKIMRKTHIDELPQLFNVLIGNMSIVGPRPERPELVKELRKAICDYDKRLLVKPGITGLAQVWHTYDTTIKDVRKKIKYDLLYIREMCLMVDLRILLRTIFVAVLGRGAR